MTILLASSLAIAAVVTVAGGVATAATANPVLYMGQSTANSCSTKWLTPLQNDVATRESAYETLIKFNGYGQPYTSGVLSSWTVGGDKTGANKVLIMTLKPNIHFSDGSLLDASAVKTYVDWRATQASANYGSTFIPGPPPTVTVLSKYKVAVHTTVSNPQLAFAFTQVAGNWGSIASPKAVAQAVADPNSPVWTQGSYGFGPYMFDASQSVVGDHCVYVPNPDYYDKSKQVWGQVVVKVYADPNSMLAALQTGQIDIALNASPSIVTAAKNSGLGVYSYARLVTSMWIRDHKGNLTQALADPRVRQAMNYAIDRNAILKSVYLGLGQATSNPNPGTDGSSPAINNYYKYDPAKAKALLAAAGYPNGFTIQVFSAQGGFGFGLDAETAAVCKYWGDVGINCNIHSSPASSATGDLFNTKYDVAAAVDAVWPTNVWYTLYMVPPSQRADQYGWTDPVTLKEYLSALKMPPAKALAVWPQIMQHVVDQGFSIGLTIYYSNTLVNPKKVAGQVRNPYAEVDDLVPAT
jgi:peptide/nickel transport system substrate-binding protein